MTVALADTVLDLPWPGTPPLLNMIIGGEQVRARDWSSYPFSVVNGYGPTEASILTLAGLVSHLSASDRVPIGVPLPGVTARIARRDG